MNSKVLSLEEVAKLLGVSERTIRREVKAGKLRAFRVGSQLRFRPESVDEYMKNQEIAPGSRTPIDEDDTDEAA